MSEIFCNILRTDVCSVDYFRNENASHTKIAFVFCPMMNRILDGNAFGGEFLIHHGYDVVSFKVTNDDWFQGLPEHLFDDIEALIAERNYDERIGYGASMGGYAAIAFSRKLKLDRAVCFSPQFAIDQSFDTRWQPFASLVEWRYKIELDQINPKARITVLFDPYNPDIEHVRRISEVCENVALIALPYAGHPVTHFLNEMGLLKVLAQTVLDDGDLGDFRRRMRVEKKRSPTYQFTLSAQALARGHLAAAYNIMLELIKNSADRPEYHWHTSNILSAMGRAEEAIAAAQKALALDPQNANLANHLDMIRQRHGSGSAP